MATILITGARGGIGRDAGLALAKRGHRVIALTKEQLDITDQQAIEQLDLVPDVVINNAAVGESGPMAEVPMERVRGLFEVNVFGTLAVTQHFAKQMLKRKTGRIIIVGSTAGRIVLPYLGPYHMTKYAVEAMGDALRMELAPYGIFVSLIEPGLIGTGFNERMADTKYTWLSASSAFASDIPKMKAHDAELPKNSHTTESVVEALIHAVESPHPRARYVAPAKYARLLTIAKFLPTRILDRIMRRSAGLGS